MLNSTRATPISSRLDFLLLSVFGLALRRASVGDEEDEEEDDEEENEDFHLHPRAMPRHGPGAVGL